LYLTITFPPLVICRDDAGMGWDVLSIDKRKGGLIAPSL